MTEVGVIGARFAASRARPAKWRDCERKVRPRLKMVAVANLPEIAAWKMVHHMKMRWSARCQVLRDIRCPAPLQGAVNHRRSVDAVVVQRKGAAKVHHRKGKSGAARVQFSSQPPNRQ